MGTMRFFFGMFSRPTAATLAHVQVTGMQSNGYLWGYYATRTEATLVVMEEVMEEG
jgi:hypothetical protein